jgi:hypothetical protein
LGDADAFENGVPLPKWWLVVDPQDVDKLMVVDRFDQRDAARIAAYAARPEYLAMRSPGQTLFVTTHERSISEYQCFQGFL